MHSIGEVGLLGPRPLPRFTSGMSCFRIWGTVLFHPGLGGHGGRVTWCGFVLSGKVPVSGGFRGL